MWKSRTNYSFSDVNEEFDWSLGSKLDSSILEPVKKRRILAGYEKEKERDRWIQFGSCIYLSYLIRS